MIGLDGAFTRYVGRLFIVRFAGLLLFFIIVLQMLDLLNRSEAINAAAGAGPESIARYISLRAPQIASQFTPFAALLAIVVTLSSLNLSSEIVVMRAAGMSIHRVLRPIGAACLVIAIAHFLFHESMVVPRTAELEYWEANDYEVGLKHDASTRTNLKLLLDGEIVAAASAARTNEGVRLSNVTVYQLDAAGLARTVIEARAALFGEDGWRLIDARAPGPQRVTATLASTPWKTTLDPETLFALSLNPDRAGMAALIRQIRQLDRDGADSGAATTSLLSRFSKPMATLIMPLLGAIAGFGVSRQGNQLVRASAGAALGFLYFVAENLMLAIGKLGAIPPMLGAFFPFALFLVVGFAILLAMEN